jgi:LysM repeat protein
VTSPVRTWATRLTTAATTAALLLLGLPAVLASSGPGPAAQRDPVATSGVLTDELRLVSHRAKHPHRKVKKYRVRPGDTPSSVAVRYHAWTAQLIAMNHTSTLYVGQVIRIPVVVKAARRCDRHRHHHTGYLADNKDRTKKHGHGKHDKPGKKSKPKKHKPKKNHAHRHPDHGWVHGGASRTEVRHVIAKKARRVGVEPHLALAIAWQESGWQHKQVSSAGALGAMQVMPGTGRWMSAYLGRKLNLRNLHDNVSAGVVLIKVLRGQTKLKYTIAGYYQGLAGVRRYGMYKSTKRYVANVLAIKRALGRGWDPV